MSVKISWRLTALLTVCELAVSSMVLPRPPSSPNGPSREAGPKFRNEKPIYSLVQLNTNVEKPNTDGYRLLEIELAGASDVDEANLRGLVRAMLSNEETESEIEHEAENQREEDENEEEEEENENDEEDQQRHPEVADSPEARPVSHPRPEIIPNSSLGVRAIVAPPSNYLRGQDEREVKRTLVRPPPEVEESRSRPSSDFGRRLVPSVKVESRGKIGSYAKSLSVKYGRPKKYPGTGLGPETVGERSRGRYEGATSSSWRLTPNSRENRHGAITSTELPKQIPTPPSRFLSLVRLARTTPVQKYTLGRRPLVLAPLAITLETSG